MLPASRLPRVRDPITKSLLPSIIGVTSRSIISGQSLPSPSRKTTISHWGEIERSPALNARPYPGMGSVTTRAPAALAISAVRSLLPLSTTTISPARSFGTELMTFAIASSSFSAAMITEINGCGFSLVMCQITSGFSTQPDHQSKNHKGRKDKGLQYKDALGSVIQPSQIEQETRAG